MVQIRSILGELKSHFGAPRTPIKKEDVVGAVYDGDWNYLGSAIATSMFGGSIVVDAVQKVESGGKRTRGVWSTWLDIIPPPHTPMRVQLCIRTGYLHMVSPERIVFDIAKECATHALLHRDVCDCRDERFLVLTAMYCGFAELCFEHALYELQRIACDRSEVILMGKQRVFTNDEVQCALHLISEMREGAEPPCMDL